MLEVEVETPKAIHLEVKFADGKTVTCPRGSKTKALLTGDQVGYVMATLDALRKQAKREGAMDSEVVGGGVKFLTEGYDVVPVGSKKHRALHPEEYDGEVHKSQKKAHKEAKDQAAHKDAPKAGK